MKESYPASQENLFNKKKTKYFSRLAVRMRDSLKMHKTAGLWERVGDRRDWGNVSEHCLVEAARVTVFAEKLQFSDGVKKDLVFAAAMHDFFKKAEKEMSVDNKLNWELYDKLY